ncbi:MAG: HAD family phosphatase [Chloroflexi bacterium]|nr:HAD family phosphatase [Chloroflexota bacterium]
MFIKAIIWDFGGVIIRTEDPASREQLIADLGVTRDYLSELTFSGEAGTRAQLGEITQAELWQHVRSELNLAPSEYPDLMKRFFGGDVVDFELVDYIRSLRSRYTTALLSNAWNDLRGIITNRWNFADAFDVMVISGEEGVMKPDPRIYQIALERSGVQPPEAVFIDDSIENIEAARKIGMHGIHFQNPEQALVDLEKKLGHS